MRKTDVERLRETIFGSQIEDYERRFSDLRREIERLLTDLVLLQDSVGDVQKAQTRIVETVEPELRRSMEELRRDVDRVRTQDPLLQQLLVQVRQQQALVQGLAGSLDEVRDALVQQEQDRKALKNAIAELRDQQMHKLDTLRQELRQADDDLRAELRHVVDRLDDQKSDRRTLAAMFSEISSRLETGGGVTNLLEGFLSPSKE
jgi:chromosome segregation ATPase